MIQGLSHITLLHALTSVFYRAWFRSCGRREIITRQSYDKLYLIGFRKTMALVKIILVNLLPLSLVVLSARGQTCTMGVGQYALCQCEMSDGSGIIDLSPYGNANGEHE